MLAPYRASALVSPVGVSLVPPLQLPFRHNNIIGLRLNILMGLHESVYGLDIGGFGNMTDRRFGGIQLAGLFNRNAGPAYIFGLQFAGLMNWNAKDSTIAGLQLTAGFNYNRGKAEVYGLQIGGIGNRCDGKVAGAQIGLYNQAKEVYGLQIGLINLAKALHGVQIGLVNVNMSGFLPFFPIINVGI
jgi:hypothetical protein